MANIDIPLPEALTKALTPPACVDLRLPKPKLPKITLPTGGTIKGIADVTAGIPNDCSMNFNIALQLAPMMASMECLLKVLKFISVIKEILTNFNPVTAVGDTLTALDDLKDCLLVPTPVIMIPFLRDLLAMLAKMLRCAAQALKSVIQILDGLSLDIADAQMNGNDALLAQLECAKENAELAMEGAMMSLEPVLVLLSLAEPFLGIAGREVKIGPFVSDGTLDGMKSLLETIETAATLLESIAEAL